MQAISLGTGTFSWLVNMQGRNAGGLEATDSVSLSTCRTLMLEGCGYVCGVCVCARVWFTGYMYFQGFK